MKTNRRGSTFLLNIFRLILILTLLQVPRAGYAQENANSCSSRNLSYAKFSVDGVELEICTAFLKNLEFIASDPQDIVQSATAIDDKNVRRTISISAIPYGTQSPIESFPVAFKGAAEVYRKLTRSYRQSQNGNPKDSEPIEIFGYTATGIVSVIDASTSQSPVSLREWFVEAGDRIWIVRITRPIEGNPIRRLDAVDFANQIEINSRHLSAPSTSLIASKMPESFNPNPKISQSADSDLSFPSWWNGECNKNNHRRSLPLGPSYRGVKACGPLAELYKVYFFNGAVQQYEWQCVELVMRFMYLAYGVKPYWGNGKDVVNNFPTSQYQSLKVEKITNGTPQKAPRPGDVISYGSNSTYGHTSIVSESNVDSNGNGSIKVIEQNYSASGTRTHQVRNWVVKASNNVDNWLHFNSGETPPAPPPNHSPRRPSPSRPDDWHVQRDGHAPTLCWNNNGDPDGDSVEFYAEVFDSAKGANSGWRRDTCWRPGDLDGHYFNYQWRVKAKDSRGAESGWSDVRHFTIEAPNHPPTISFDTANDNGASTIPPSRDQNWTFRGTAHDDEGRLNRVEFHCSGDSCNTTDRAELTGNGRDTTWKYQRNGISGRNYVYFQAYDDKQSSKSRTLQLDIDLASPTTDVQINGLSAGAWPQWFNTPAQVHLNARDNGTGRATADVKEVHYRRDNGGQQVQSGATVNFSESGDGEHTVHFYAVDKAGNSEGEHSATFRVDRTPSTVIGGVQESHGLASDTWQKDHNTPTFTWNASSDALSGLGGYQFYFGQDANGTAVHKDVAAGAKLEWTPNTPGVATGTYYLRGRTWDKAGNTSTWQTLFVFKYDGTPPPNPGQAIHADGPKNDTWQKITARPNFTWTPPTDEGSGMKGYLVYWGADAKGESTNFITANNFQSSTPLCNQGQACVGYLRLRSQDNVDLQAEKWSTTFVLRYDAAPPVADFTVNGGVTQTSQSLVSLDINATDQGSGLREMRLSNDGANWTPWETYDTSRVWEIPAISRQSWPIYLQVKDAVGWESQVVSRTVYFDVNVDQPRSQSYRLFDYAQVAGGGSHTSSGYQGHSTVGQVADSPRITSTSYSLVGGYQAGSQAIPLVVPGHDEFSFINGIFASGVVNDTMTSGQYRMVGVWGEPALPNNRTEIASASYRFQPGFLAARPSAQGTPTPTVTPTPGPTPTPTPTPDCEFPTVSIDNGAVFTTDTQVTLSLCAPNATEMMISNDGGFGGANWEAYARSKAWTLTSLGSYVVPRFVYAVFKDAAGNIYSTYLDDIILDPTPPNAKLRVGTSLPLDKTLLAAARAGRAKTSIFQATGQTYIWNVNGRSLADPLPLLRAKADGSVDLYLSARDDVGNVTQMEVSGDSSFSGSWESYSALKQWTPGGGDGVKTVYARFQDEAGNASQAYTATFALDTLPPVGGIALSHPILGSDVVTTTVWLGAEDNLSGVADMRLSTDATFADAVWRPFASTTTWTYAAEDYTRSALYVQFRDAAGNESQVYDAALLMDDTPPLVYVEVEPGDTLTRTLRIYSYDELTYPDRMRITNDPIFLEGVVTQPYSDTLTWVFDQRQVVWVQVKDSVGNWSEPYPAYAELPTEPAPENRLYLPEIQSAAPGRGREGIPTSGLEWRVYLPALEQ